MKKQQCIDCQRLCQEGRMQNPKEEHSINKEDSKRRIQKDCIAKKIIYSHVSKVFYGHCFNCINFGHKIVNCRMPRTKAATQGT
jgi:hypothetical protein